MMLVSPKGHEIHAQFPEGERGADSYVAPRMYFDHVIQRQAVESGVEFCRAQVKEPIIEDGNVIGVRARINGSEELFHSSIVVGADGVTSSITRNLRSKESQHVDKHRAVAIRAYIDDIEEIPGEVEFYLYDEILPGYAWIFPLGDDKANIGLGMRLDMFRKHKLNLEKMLRDFLQMPAIKSRLKNGGELRDIATWQLNFGSQKDLQTTFNGAILVGDAAGFINPLTGGGIHNSIISAELAADIIESALQKGDTSRDALKIYEQQCHDEMWKSMVSAYRFQRSFMYFPVLVDILVRFGKQSGALTQTFLSKL
jgi:flavin-dependent dehydrogenase